ncbi:tol-pal system YbgF family protein [Actinomadura sp. WMMB 499]|uniref:tetratricopeptide repeat protein n=1 Tax=Actinomadura sp. WMMB 499 TaxID=1219491 RepID=UPI001247A0DF|nr:hypothetical protein [Actinomadura sp. WMMB 499]QFG20117.1 hypothetical protein F7P10_01980 [Actinomadura sp. WMMB 499]
MERPTRAVPDAHRPHGRLAVAVANASLLNVGYLMLGRRRLAAVTGMVTLVLVVALATAVRSAWLEVVLLLWWAALVGHGWGLAAAARRAEDRTARRERLVVALCCALPVLATVSVLRVDAAGIDGTVAQARRDGECAEALEALDEVWFGHRLVAAPMTARGDATTRACRRVEEAADDLAAGLAGDLGALAEGFDGLAAVQADSSGHGRMVGAALERFLSGLPADDPCTTVRVTDWLRGRKAGHDLFDRSAAVVARTAPPALVDCGNAFLDRESWVEARTHYRKLLDQYPDDGRAGEARKGAEKATLAIELANVRELLDGGSGSQPEYCSAPAKYGGAEPYGDGTNRAIFVGDGEHTGELPGGWRTTDPADAVLVVCLGEQDYGPVQRSCPYTYGGGKRTTVRFHEIEIPAKAYELRTGELVSDTAIRIGGGSCPAVIPYTTFGTDTGPPTKDYVDPSGADVRAAFESLIKGD